MFFQSKRYNILDQRYNIAFFSAIFAFLSTIIYSPEFYNVFIYYIVFGLAFDQFMSVIKPAPLTEGILNRHKMTTEQIETYVKSKKTYRLVAVSIAFFVGLIAKVLGFEFGLYFILSYVGIWSFYPFIRKFFLKIPAPQFVRTLTEQEWQKQRHFTNNLYDEHNPSSPAWHHAQCNRVHQIMNSLNSHSKTLL